MGSVIIRRQRLLRSWRREPARGCVEEDLLRAYDQDASHTPANMATNQLKIPKIWRLWVGLCWVHQHKIRKDVIHQEFSQN